MKIAVYNCINALCDAYKKEVRKDAEVERKLPNFCNVCGKQMWWLRNEEPTKTIPRVLGIRDNINVTLRRPEHVAATVTLGEVFDGFYELYDAMPTLVGALERSEEFIRGFEDDEMQRGMKELLRDIRAAIKLGGSFNEQPRSNRR